MNEVTKIHLGRQAYAISNEAHRELRDYLDAIKRRVHEDDVVSEVEMRMAELLSERGVDGDKVILPADVDYLREQLGDPKDFAGDDETAPEMEHGASGTKRLFRDTDNAMLAGVAAGLASYFGVDVLLIRLLFIIFTFASGTGILIYLVLWLLVPEVKTPSDRLIMAGKPVTIESLKEVVERADLKGAAQRANNSLTGPINAGFKALLKVIGIAFVIFGLALLLSIAATGAYAFLRSGAIVQGGIFPVGFKEHLLIYVAAGVCAIISLFIVIFGMAVFWRKWPIRSWLTGTLIGLMLIGITVGSALAADVAPQVRNRYNADFHTTTYSVQPFTKVNLDNVNDSVSYQFSPKYSLSLRYFDHPNISEVKYSVSNGVLSINTRQFDQNRYCNGLCIPNNYDLTVIVSAPNPPTAIYPGIPDAPTMPSPESSNSNILQD
jgi:phage shock protein PspC (stress-responsive transcriptional regulator)